MLVSGGATNVTTYFSLRLAADSTAATGLTITGFDLQYTRSGAAPSTKVDATALAATDSAHGDNQAFEIDSTDQPGLYRVDWPDAAFAAGVREVVLTVKVATAFTEHLRVEIDAIADPVWDEILTGATHNIATSAGRRLRALQDFGLYEGGAVWIDTVSGTAGTTDFENGTVTNPVDTIADAKTLADSLGLKRFQIIAGSTITLAATFDNYAFSSDDGWTLALGGQSVDSASFFGAAVSGTFTGTPHLVQCVVNAITGPSARIGRCGLASTITANAAGDWFIHHCWSEVAGASTPIFDYGTTAAVSSNVTFAAYSNGIEIRNLNNQGTDLLSLAGVGQVVYAASSSGAVNQRGDWKVTNTGGVTITQDDNTANIAATLVDTTEIGASGAGLTEAGGTGDQLTALATAASVAALNDYDPAAQLTEAYAANGVAPTTTELLFAVHQVLMQFGIAGTSNTVRKLNNTDTAFVVTLDDDTSPTDAKRV